jgi:trimethylamine:corrinoid methyltransferase-like protein
VEKEHFIPRLLDKKSVDMWRRGGSKALNTVAREYVEKMLKEHSVEPLPPDIEKSLDNAVLEMLKRWV